MITVLISKIRVQLSQNRTENQNRSPAATLQCLLLPCSKTHTHPADSASTLPQGTLQTKFHPQNPNAPFHRLADWWQNSGNNAFLNVTWNRFDCTNFTLWSLPFQLKPHQLPSIKITGFHHLEGHWLIHCRKLLGYISPGRDLNVLLPPLRPSPPLQLEEASFLQN